MSELISKQDAIDAAIEAVDSWYQDCSIGRQMRIHKTIMALPPVQKAGKWIDTNGCIMSPEWERYKCSVCGNNSLNYDYCPHCGAKMEGIDDNR